ncbi:transcriptional regulator [Bacillus phage PfEFR-4]|uniref:Transcriptional regulator n=1 Tax=Bacillus phage PfEFR-4 TaxID=1868598 RepID=A0A1B1P7T0_9CAUD|nr:transcriptional regulator [Bacillus phage PfEFR-4]ANT40171.1 transcriptional regulator [Bacillus phage PfEFR-4]
MVYVNVIKGRKQMNHKLISKRVKEIRTEILKMSQSEFINALGLKSKSAVSMWENEEIDKCPSNRYTPFICFPDLLNSLLYQGFY